MATFNPVSALSLEYVNVLWGQRTPWETVADPTGEDVQFAFPVSSGDLAAPAQPVTWFTGSWVPGSFARGKYIAQCLIGPGGTVTLIAGNYDVWSKITGSPESPVLFVGVLPVY